MSHSSLGQQTLGQDPDLEVTHAETSPLYHHSLTGHCPTSLSWWAPAGGILQQGTKGEAQLLIPVISWGVCWTLFLSFLEGDVDVCEHRADDGENLSLFPAGEDPPVAHDALTVPCLAVGHCPLFPTS